MAEPLKSAPYRHDAVLFQKVASQDQRGKCALKNLGAPGAQTGHSSSTERSHRSSQVTALVLGTSSRMVERIRYILDHGTPEIQARLKAGEVSIADAHRTVQRHQKALKESEPREFAERAPLAGVILRFVKEPIPGVNYSRTWTLEENQLILRLIRCLEEHGWLSKDEADALQGTQKKRFSPNFRGPHNGTAPAGGSHGS